MRSKLSLFDLFAVLALALTFAKTAVVYDRLPVLMPSHFGPSGAADAWMPRERCAWLVPKVAAALWAGVRAMGLIAARFAKPGDRLPNGAGLALVPAVSLCAVQALVLDAALSPPPRLSNAIWVVLAGSILASLAFTLPAIKPRV